MSLHYIDRLPYGCMSPDDRAYVKRISETNNSCIYPDHTLDHLLAIIDKLSRKLCLVNDSIAEVVRLLPPEPKDLIPRDITAGDGDFGGK